MRVLTFLSVAFLVIVNTVQATSYYVATNGLNVVTNGLGLSPAAPWKTLQYAESQTSAGDTIYLAAGTYTEQVGITNSITIIGANSYSQNAPCFSRHTTATILRPATNFTPGASVITLLTNNVSLQNITINGDADEDGVADVPAGIWSTQIPVTIRECVLETFSGYAVLAQATNNAASDTDAKRSYFGHNYVSNIVTPSGSFTAGFLLEHVPATLEFNAFTAITGTTANTGMYIDRCYYTSNMTLPLLVVSNCFDTVNLSIWANQFGTDAEKISIQYNTITNGIFGIRVTAARGQALISNNTVNVSGAVGSTTGTPAIGIWIHADHDPWDTTNTINATDHQVVANRVSGSSVGADGTVGMLFAYDTLTETNINNGLHATVYGNTLQRFDSGMGVETGTNMVSRWADPLVVVNIHNNFFTDMISHDIYYSGGTNTLIATNNWFGPTGPANISSNVLTWPWQLGLPGIDTDSDGLDDNIDPDDDNDGISDLDESIIGSSSIISNSISFGLEPALPGVAPNETLMCWLSKAGRIYNLYRSTNLLSGFTQVLTNAPATPPLNCYTDTVGNAFYQIDVSIP